MFYLYVFGKSLIYMVKIIVNISCDCKRNSDKHIFKKQECKYFAVSSLGLSFKKRSQLFLTTFANL